MAESVQVRGDQLRRRILLAAKTVFLDSGFAGASMDAVAAEAQTSKRSLYAHFANKDALFLAVLELVRDLTLERVGEPAASGAIGEALTLYLARFQQQMCWETQVRTSRLAIAESGRLSDATVHYFEQIFDAVRGRVAARLRTEGWEEEHSLDSAGDLIAVTVLPRALRMLFGGDRPIVSERPPAADRLGRDVDVDDVRMRVTRVLSDAHEDAEMDASARA